MAIIIGQVKYDGLQAMPLILHRSLKGARLKSVPSGQIILYEGDLPQMVYIIKSGIVKLYDTDEDGNEKLLHLVKAPSVIPFAFFSGGHEPIRWFYAALTECELYEMPAADLRNMTRTNAEISELLTGLFSRDVHELLVRLNSLSKTTAQNKILAALRFFIALHSSERRGGWWRVNFPVNQQLIADLCGITRESASGIMKYLREKKTVRYSRINVLEIHKINLERML